MCIRSRASLRVEISLPFSIFSISLSHTDCRYKKASVSQVEATDSSHLCQTNGSLTHTYMEPLFPDTDWRKPISPPLTRHQRQYVCPSVSPSIHHYPTASFTPSASSSVTLSLTHSSDSQLSISTPFVPPYWQSQSPSSCTQRLLSLSLCLAVSVSLSSCLSLWQVMCRLVSSSSIHPQHYYYLHNAASSVRFQKCR